MIAPRIPGRPIAQLSSPRSEEHTSELQSQSNLVCRLLLEKKNAHHSLHPSNPLDGGPKIPLPFYCSLFLDRITTRDFAHRHGTQRLRRPAAATAGAVYAFV